MKIFHAESRKQQNGSAREKFEALPLSFDRASKTKTMELPYPQPQLFQDQTKYIFSIHGQAGSVCEHAQLKTIFEAVKRKGSLEINIKQVDWE